MIGNNDLINFSIPPTNNFFITPQGNQIAYQPYFYPPLLQVSQPFYVTEMQYQPKSKDQKESLYMNYIRNLPFNDKKNLLNAITTEVANKQIELFLETALYHEVKYFLYSIIVLLPDLMKNNISNLYIQKLFPLLQSKERFSVINRIKSNLVSLSCSFYSTYCIQELIKSCKYQNEEDFLISLIVESLPVLSTDKLGNHVLQCILFRFKSSSIKQIESFLLGNFLNLSRNKYGISIMKVFVELKAADKGKIKKSIINIILNNKHKFFTDEIAHYLLLHIIKTW